MALKLSTYVSTNLGITATNVYVKIINANVENTGTKTVMADYAVFADAAAASSDKQPLGFGRLNFPFDALATIDVVAQGYAQMKLLPEFSSSINV